MIRLLYALILLAGMAFSPTVSASIWSWIDTLSACSATQTYCYDYNFTIADWDEDDSTPNPCYSLSACTIFIGHRHNAAGTSGSGIVRSWGAGAYPFIIESETVGDLAKQFKAIFSLPFSSTTNHKANTVATEECVGLFYAAGKNLGSNNSAVNQTAFEGHPIMPGSICGSAPAPSGSCDFDQDVLTLDHGTLTRQELEGHEVSENVSISCTTSQTLKLYIYSSDHVPLRDDGSLYSELYMNDNILGSAGFTLEVAEQENVTVKSILHTNGNIDAGEFSGSTVMLITVE
ncbi:MrpH family fimbial adhesin [Raoultella ornithinolytica]|uniref:MrpH family fimbial adhesin n=1 Tax=Raoultella ornithinolytica TaxID=54291 RepID=UPI0013EF66CB|nr:hypothetical protein [Raoultella ornithinolytica]MDN3781896.1 hypothetical protein [Raoultella ornithinolytica]MEB6463953.1 hypothetical protein [Raoultella ornithinolytica]QLJ44965.1 hypothetical protein HYH04_21030 [Raoultella ornithinolytica]HCT9584252.1 hypothetical protein [Raoultella ornithinolytica]HDH7817011.1 hypothetical protein [Raoultella ornithinolytica]